MRGMLEYHVGVQSGTEKMVTMTIYCKSVTVLSFGVAF